MKRQLVRALTLWRDDRGVALPLALMALMVLGALSAALLTIGGSEVQISYNHLRGTQAQFTAEAGLEDVFNFYRADTSKLPSFTATAADTCATITLSGPGTTLTTDYGSYSVTCKVLGPNTVLITSTGTSKIGSSQKVLRAIITNGFASDDALRTKGPLDSSGTALTVSGSCGSVHTNGKYTKSGAATPTFSEGLTATGTVPDGSPDNVKGSKPEKLIPKINTSDFWAAAKATLTLTTLYEYRSDGTVYDGTDALKATVPNNGTYRGWQYKTSPSVHWELDSASDASGATYYFKTNVDIGKTMTAAIPMTILATGDITVSAKPLISPHLTATLLVSDMDIDMNGTPGTSISGLIAAHEQIELSGNVSITGSIIAEDGAAASGTVTSNSIGGSVEITYDCDQGPPITGPVRYLAWGF